jgi:putative phosphoribosyl transferase
MPIMERQWTTTIEQQISISAGEAHLRGELVVPEDVLGLVLFAHGADMSRSNPGSQSAIRELEQQGLAVLAFDLLSIDEEDEEIHTGRPAVGMPELASRYLAIAAWASSQPELRELPIGLLSTGSAAAAALAAAAEQPGSFGAVVCLNGRVDLTDSTLAQVQPPTLLIVGAADASIVRSNESALLRLGSMRRELIMIPGSPADSDEPADLGTAAGLTAEWLSQSLVLV